MCDADLLINFEFNEGDDELVDSSCNKVPCFTHGTSHVEDNALWVNGEGDYCEVSVVRNTTTICFNALIEFIYSSVI